MRVASCHEQINFKAGGYLLVDVYVDLFEVSKEDRELAMGIVDQVREYIIKSGGQTSFQPRELDTDMMDSPLNKVADGLAVAQVIKEEPNTRFPAFGRRSGCGCQVVCQAAATDTMMSNCQLRVVRGDDGKLTDSKLAFPPREDLRPNPNPAETFAPPSDAHPSHQVLINKVVQAAQRVINAINDAGSHPAYHAEVKQKAQWAWPYLWDRLASLQLAFLDLEAPRSVSPDPDIEEPSE